MAGRTGDFGRPLSRNETLAGDRLFVDGKRGSADVRVRTGSDRTGLRHIGCDLRRPHGTIFGAREQHGRIEAGAIS